MRIAVCDDLPGALVEARKLLEQISFVKQVDLFSDIHAFYEEMQEGTRYDAVLMDIDWKGDKTGVDFAAELQQKDSGMQIIYITAYVIEYVEDVFLRSSELVGFLMKPLKREQLEKSLEKVRKRKKTYSEKLVIRGKGKVMAIPFDSICYLESHAHTANIITTDTVYQCSERLDEIMQRLGRQFLICHKSYIVNMDQIAEFRSGAIQMDDGKVIPVSKARCRAAKNRFSQYVFDKM